MINILSLSSTTHTVEAYVQIVNALKNRKFQVKHIGLSPYQWLLSPEDFVGNAYKKHGIKHYLIPRFGFKSEPSMIGETFRLQFKKSFPLIADFIEKLTVSWSPDIFLCDSEKYLPMLISKTLNQNLKVPVILIQHGCAAGLDYQLIYKNFLRKKMIDLYRTIMFDLPELFKKKFFHLNDLEIFKQNPRVYLFGERFGDYVCCFSRLDTNVIKKYSNISKKIIDTGYPYFDLIFQKAAKNLSLKRVNNLQKKILFVSGGTGDRFPREAVKFYSIFIKFCRKFGQNKSIYLRLKPGEKLESFLSRKMLNNIQKLNFRMDDNAQPSYQQMAQYDLVIGDASMVLFEAMIFNKPVIVLDYWSLKYMKEFINRLWRTKINALIVKNFTELKKIVSNNSYSKIILHEKYSDIFDKVDGLAGERIAKLIEKLVNG